MTLAQQPLPNGLLYLIWYINLCVRQLKKITQSPNLYTATEPLMIKSAYWKDIFFLTLYRP